MIMKAVARLIFIGYQKGAIALMTRYNVFVIIML